MTFFSAFDPKWKKSNQSEEALAPTQSLELKTQIKEMHTEIETSENVGCIENNHHQQCESAGETDLSVVLLERSMQTGKKKTPMCLVNELARHYKVNILL